MANLHIWEQFSFLSGAFSFLKKTAAVSITIHYGFQLPIHYDYMFLYLFQFVDISMKAECTKET